MCDRYRPRELGTKRKREYIANSKSSAGPYRLRGELNGTARLEDGSRYSYRNGTSVNPRSPTEWTSNGKYVLHATSTPMITDTYSPCRPKCNSEKDLSIIKPCGQLGMDSSSIVDTMVVETKSIHQKDTSIPLPKLHNGSLNNHAVEKRLNGIDQKSLSGGHKRPNKGEASTVPLEHSPCDIKMCFLGESSSDEGLSGFLPGINPIRGRGGEGAVDQSVREFSRKGRPSPVESVSTTEDENGKPDHVYSVNEVNFRRNSDIMASDDFDQIGSKSEILSQIHSDRLSPTKEASKNVENRSEKINPSDKTTSTDFQRLPETQVVSIRKNSPLQSPQSTYTTLPSPSLRSSNRDEAAKKLTKHLANPGIAKESTELTIKRLVSVHSLPPKPTWTFNPPETRHVETGANKSNVVQMSESRVTGKATSENLFSAESSMSISSGGSPASSVSSSRKRSTLAKCIQCKEGAVPPFRILIQCVNCNCNYHAYCHSPSVPTKDGKLINVDVDTWICSRCSKTRELSPQPRFLTKLSTPKACSVNPGCATPVTKKKLEIEVESSNVHDFNTGTSNLGASDENGRLENRYHNFEASVGQMSGLGAVALPGKWSDSIQSPSKEQGFRISNNLVTNVRNKGIDTFEGHRTDANNYVNGPCSPRKVLISSTPCQRDTHLHSKLRLEPPSKIQDPQLSQGPDCYLSDVSMDLSPVEEVRTVARHAAHNASTSEKVIESTAELVGINSCKKPGEGEDTTGSTAKSSPPYSPPYSPTLNSTPIASPTKASMNTGMEAPTPQPTPSFPPILPLQPSYPMGTPPAIQPAQSQIPTVLQQLLSSFSNGSVTFPCALCTKPFTTFLSLARPDGLNYCLACQRSGFSVPNLVYSLPAVGNVAPGPISSDAVPNFQINTPVSLTQRQQPAEDQRNSSSDHSEKAAPKTPQLGYTKATLAIPKATTGSIAAASDNRTEKDLEKLSEQSSKIVSRPFIEPGEPPFKRPKTAAEIVQERYQASQKVFVPGQARPTRLEAGRGNDQTLPNPEKVKERKKYSFQQYAQKKLIEVSEGRLYPTTKKNAEHSRNSSEEQDLIKKNSFSPVKATDPRLTALTAVDSTNLEQNDTPRQGVPASIDNSVSSPSVEEALNWKKKYEEQKGFVLNHVKHIQKLINAIEKERQEKTALEEKVASLEALLAASPERELVHSNQSTVNGIALGASGKDSIPGPSFPPKDNSAAETRELALPASQKEIDVEGDDRPVLISSLYKDFTFEVTELKLKCPEEIAQIPVTKSSRVPYSAVRKHRYPLLAGTNPRSLHVHRQVDRESFYFAPGTASNDASRDVSVATDEEEDVCLAQFLQLPNNLVPSLKDGMLAFRSAQVSARSRRLERNSRVYKVGRDVPGELRGLK